MSIETNLSSDMPNSCKKPSIIISDLDGCITDGKFLNLGEERHRFIHSRDARGLELLSNSSIAVYFFSSSSSSSGLDYLRDLGAEGIFTSFRERGLDKKEAVKELLLDLDVSYDKCWFIGDDTQDIEMMSMGGRSFCPADAHPEVIRQVDHVSQKIGGLGFFREIADIALALESGPNDS